MAYERSLDKVIRLAGTQHVSSYTRTSKTGHTVHVSAYTRSVSRMSLSDLRAEFNALKSGKSGLSGPASENRQTQIVNELRKRGDEPKAATHKPAVAKVAAKVQQVAVATHLKKKPVDDSIVGTQQVLDMTGGSAEKYLVHQPDGTYKFNAERHALHEKIIAKILAGQTAQAHPVYNVMGGGPAAGKSTMEKANPEISANSALINADEIKAELPEYTSVKDGTAAAFTHEESSYLTALATQRAFAAKFNVTLDGTGDSNVGKMRGKIEAARKRGYKVNGYYATVPTDEAVQRANLRGQKTGRFVPESVIRATHKNVSVVFPLLLNDFDSVALYDTSTKSPVKILEKTGKGKPKILDEDRWKAFLDKGEQTSGK